MAIVVTLALLGVGIFLATNNPSPCWRSATNHAAAAGEEKSAFLAAGQAMLANTGQRAVGGFNTGLFLVPVAGLLASIVMLRAGVFGRATAWVGIAAHALSLADYIRQALTSSPIVVLLVVLPNALLLVIWYVLVGRGLFRLREFPRRLARKPKSEAPRRKTR